MSIVRLSIYTALVLVATIVLQIYTPATRGYFNLGESAIYSIASTASPLVTAIAAGVGSALADLVTGYGVFAPGTLVIKGVEGFLVAYLIRVLSRLKISQVKTLSAVIAVLVGLLISVAGIRLWSGSVELTSIPVNVFGAQFTFIYLTLDISAFVWIIIGVIISLLVIYMIWSRGVENISTAVAMSIGGFEMVLGYFLYEYFVSNPLQGIPPQAAFVEVPVNLGQALFGLSIALPISSFLRKASK
ncbi:MAG: ECF transporter S component [Sulfolobales archaeon]